MLLLQLNLQAAGGGSVATQVEKFSVSPQGSSAREIIGYGAVTAISAALLTFVPPPPMASANTTFGTHELAVKESQFKGQIRGQSLGQVAPQPILRTFVAREQDRDT